LFCQDPRSKRSLISGLIPLLKKIPGEVKHYFENIVKIILELRPDLDGNSPSELFVYIVTKNGADEAWKNMQALEEKWWFEEVGNNPVNIDVEFS